MDDRITKNVHRELRTMNGKLDEVGSVFRMMTDSMQEQIAEMKRAARPKRGGPALATGGIASDVKSIANMMRRQASIRSGGPSLAHAVQPNGLGQQLSASLAAVQSTTVVVQGPAKAEDKKSGNEEKSYWQKALEFAKTAQDYVYAASDSIKKVKGVIDNVNYVKKLFTGESGGSQCKCCCCQGGGGISSGLAGRTEQEEKAGPGQTSQAEERAPGRSVGEGTQRQKELGKAVAPSKNGAAGPPGKGGTGVPPAKGAPAASSPAKSGPATPPSAGGTATLSATAASPASAPQGKSASASTPFARARRKVTSPKPKRGLLKKSENGAR